MDQFWQIGQQEPVFGYRSLDVGVIVVFSCVAHDLICRAATGTLFM